MASCTLGELKILHCCCEFCHYVGVFGSGYFIDSWKHSMCWNSPELYTTLAALHRGRTPVCDRRTSLSDAWPV